MTICFNHVMLLIVSQQSKQYNNEINACLMAYRSRIIIVKSLSADLMIYTAMLGTTKIRSYFY